jgi:chromosome segregation ATPase
MSEKKKMSDKKAAVPLPDITGSASESADKVERIREIVFGAHMRDYAQKFELMNRELSRLNREIERLNQQLRDQESTYKRQLREEGDRLSTQLHEQDKRLTQQLQDLDKRETNEFEELDQKFTRRMQELDQVMHSSDRDLLNKLRDLSDQLNDQKVDRSSLGDWLVELGSNLKANAPAPLTTQIDDLDHVFSQLTAELA